jgi:hypothetical protein
MNMVNVVAKAHGSEKSFRPNGTMLEAVGIFKKLKFNPCTTNE